MPNCWCCQFPSIWTWLKDGLCDDECLSACPATKLSVANTWMFAFSWGCQDLSNMASQGILTRWGHHGKKIESKVSGYRLWCGWLGLNTPSPFPHTTASLSVSWPPHDLAHSEWSMTALNDLGLISRLRHHKANIAWWCILGVGLCYDLITSTDLYYTSISCECVDVIQCRSQWHCKKDTE